MTTVRRAVISGPRRLSIVYENIEVPVGHVVVAVEACGLCTFEQRVYRGARPTYPFYGGHEIGGRVVAPGDTMLAVGARVAVMRAPRCGTCPACSAGLDNLCVYLTRHSSSLGPAGLADVVVSAPNDVVSLSNVATSLEAAFVEPLACVLNSLATAGVSASSRLAIIGGGLMGVLHARAARALGVHATLIATGPSPIGLEQAWDGVMGFLSDADLVSEYGLFDVVVVVRGGNDALATAPNLLAPGGHLNLFSSIDGEITLPFSGLRKKGARITSSASHRRRDFHRAAQFVDDGEIQVRDLIFKTFPLDDVGQAFDLAVSSDSGRIMIAEFLPESARGETDDGIHGHR